MMLLRRRFIAMVAIGAALAACEAEPPAPSPPPDSPAAQPRTVITDVTWPAADRLDRAALERLRPAAVKAVARSPIPVLVPADAELLKGAALIARPNWYSFSTRSGGLTVSLSATRVAHRYEHIPPAPGTRQVRGAGGFVTQNEGIWSVTWTENGASYTLDIECSDGSDERCRNDAMVVAMSERLVYVGGQQAEVQR
jgi:hypothetical protein